MTDHQFRALLNMWMCSDESEDHILGLISEEAQKRGFANWNEAYYHFIPPPTAGRSAPDTESADPAPDDRSDRNP